MSMRTLWTLKVAICAGLALAGVLAQANLVDASILVDRAANNKTLTVKYEGASANLVEMRVNGVSVASKPLDDKVSTGEAAFSLDTASLESGDNAIEFRLYDKEGKLVGTQKTTVKIDRAGDGAVSLEKPKQGTNVQGQLEIKVSFKTDIKNAYVSFFVNDEFKALKNYAPYSYAWDTSKIENGWYDIQAWVVDEANNTFKTEKMRLFVNNPGGRTYRTGGVGFTSPKVEPVLAPSHAKPTKAHVTTLQPLAPHIPVAVKTATVTKLPMAGTAAGIKAIKPTVTKAISVPTQPSEVVTMVSPTHPVAVKVKPPISTVSITPSKVNKRISITKGSRLNGIDTFDVILKGEVVKFDVAPRVENGVPITPFRHLFEANGGSVKWDNQSKTVTGKSAGSQISFKIGEASAKVDGRALMMELAPFLIAGRAMVPLSFISDALKVDVQFDAITGHVLILSSEQAKKN